MAIAHLDLVSQNDAPGSQRGNDGEGRIKKLAAQKRGHNQPRQSTAASTATRHPSRPASAMDCLMSSPSRRSTCARRDGTTPPPPATTGRPPPQPPEGRFALRDTPPIRPPPRQSTITLQAARPVRMQNESGIWALPFEALILLNTGVAEP